MTVHKWLYIVNLYNNIKLAFPLGSIRLRYSNKTKILKYLMFIIICLYF